MKRIFWTQGEWNALAIAFAEIRSDPANKIVGKLGVFNTAMRKVLPPERWRKITAFQDVAVKLRETGVRSVPAAASPKPISVTRAADNPIQVAVENLIGEVVKEVAGTIGLLVMDEVRRQLDGAIKGLDKRILDALPKQVEVPATPTQQHVTIQTTDAVPEGVDKVAIAPKDRKPRICIAGLMNQQINDVRSEFGNIIDFSFVKNDKGSSPVVDTMRGKDLVICMTRFSSHDIERGARSVNVPVVRITGAVSALKRWLRSWINHEIAITEAA